MPRAVPLTQNHLAAHPRYLWLFSRAALKHPSFLLSSQPWTTLFTCKQTSLWEKERFVRCLTEVTSLLFSQTTPQSYYSTRLAPGCGSPSLPQTGRCLGGSHTYITHTRQGSSWTLPPPQQRWLHAWEDSSTSPASIAQNQSCPAAFITFIKL